jgi:hypothetical protein
VVPADKVGGTTKVSCPVCLGLGRFEVSKKHKRPPKSDTFTAVHSDIPIQDVIDLLPFKEPDDE